MYNSADEIISADIIFSYISSIAAICLVSVHAISLHLHINHTVCVCVCVSLCCVCKNIFRLLKKKDGHVRWQWADSSPLLFPLLHEAVRLYGLGFSVFAGKLDYGYKWISKRNVLSPNRLLTVLCQENLKLDLCIIMNMEAIATPLIELKPCNKTFYVQLVCEHRNTVERVGHT